MPHVISRRRHTLLGPDGEPYEATEPGTLGGHRRAKIYGRLDCPAARRAIGKGGYVKHRVFFADEAAAHSAGYRPCAICMPADYSAWSLSRPAGTRQPCDSVT
jgi:Metal binding domain of Ada